MSNKTTTEAMIVPHSREAEEGVLGSVLIYPEVYFDLAEFLSADDFYVHRHRWIWEAFTRLQEKHIPIDSLTVIENLDQHGKLAEIGGAAMITLLINAVPSSLNAVSYGHIVEESAARRGMLLAANQIAQMAYREDEPLEMAMDGAVKAVYEIDDKRHKRSLIPFSEVMSQVYDRVDRAAQAQQRGEHLGVSTGFRELDHLLGGLQPSDLIVVAARPGMGKTSFLLSLTKHITQQVNPKHIAIFSLEMPNEQLGLRIIAQESGLNTQRVRNGKLTETEWGQFIQAAEDLSQLPIYADDTPAISPLQLLSKARRLHRQQQLDLILVDYLQLMGGGRRFENRVQEVSSISRQLKLIAKELSVPVLAAAQLSRAVEQRADKRPVLSDLRESGAIEQDSDVVLFLYRPEDAEDGLTEVIIAKHRNGPLGVVPLRFIEQQAKFQNAV